MRKREESPRQVPAQENRKPAANWMPLQIAPLVAQRMSSRKPLPGRGRRT